MAYYVNYAIISNDEADNDETYAEFDQMSWIDVIIRLSTDVEICSFRMSLKRNDHLKAALTSLADVLLNKLFH